MCDPKKLTKDVLGRLNPAEKGGQAAEAASPGPAEIQRWLQDHIGRSLNVAADTVDPAEPFTSYGLDSIAGFTLTLELADWLQREIPASLLWDYSTTADVSRFLGEAQES